MGELFPRNGYGGVYEGNRQVAETANSSDLLEAVEKDKHKILCSDQTRQAEKRSLEFCEYKKIVLAHCEKSNPVDDSDK